MSTLSEKRTPPQNLWSVLAESKNIFESNRRHFLQLSVLFLLPLSFSTNIYYILQQTQSHPHRTSAISIIVNLIYIVISSFLSLSAAGIIYFSTYQSFFKHPVKLTSSLLALLHSFLPLMLTFLASTLIFFLVFIAYGLIVALTFGFGFTVLGFENHSSIVTILLIVEGLILVLFIFYLQVNWILSYAIVMMESIWGFEALGRSKKLVKGMRKLTISVFLFNVVCTGIWILCLLYLSKGFNGGGDFSSWKIWVLILGVAMITVVGAGLMLQSSITITVVYIYCAAEHGRGGGEVAGKYLSMHIEDGKV